MTRLEAALVPWRPAGALGITLVSGLGVLLLLAGWIGASGTPDVGEQISWLNLGVLGLIIASVAQATWLLLGRRAVGERWRRLTTDLGGFAASSPVIHSSETSGGEVVSAQTMHYYHRPRCHLMAGKHISTVGTPESHQSAGRQPCRVCEP